MADSLLQTPVALFVFNRPDLTRLAVAQIARAKPSRLLVVADGPRADQPGEADRCREARSVALAAVDWPCEVLTSFSERNLGCRQRMASGISWVFERCEQAILLEDDCVPNLSFFRYCSELLDRYKDSPRVMAVSGSNFLWGRRFTMNSYYFSALPYIWGWASWRRAWALYDPNLTRWPDLRNTHVLDHHFGGELARFWRERLDLVWSGRLDTWDYQWMFACLLNGGLAATPSVNLVANLGWRADATHTTNARGFLAQRAASDITFPLRHPSSVSALARADRYAFERVFLWYGQQPTLLARLRRMGAAHAPEWLRSLLGGARWR